MVDCSKVKCVIVVDAGLPAGLVANTAAVLAANVGRDHPEIFGPDVPDGSGRLHRGITALPFPVLKSDGPGVAKILARALEAEGLEATGFSHVAQAAVRYDDYAARLAETPAEGLRWLGAVLFGQKKLVSRLTGSLPLYR
ncbi:MAG: DUF2000 domain-containing protein [Desulfovibrionaceae bacterium]